MSLVTFLRLFVASVCVRALASPQGEVLRSAPARTSWALPAGRPVLDASPAEAAPVVAPPLAAPGTSEAPSGTLLRRKGAPADAGPTAVGRVCPPCGRTFAAMRERCTACGGPLALEGAA